MHFSLHKCKYVYTYVYRSISCYIYIHIDDISHNKRLLDAKKHHHMSLSMLEATWLWAVWRSTVKLTIRPSLPVRRMPIGRSLGQGAKVGYFVEGPNFGSMELDNNWICRIVKRAGCCFDYTTFWYTTCRCNNFESFFFCCKKLIDGGVALHDDRARHKISWQMISIRGLEYYPLGVVATTSFWLIFLGR